MARALWFSQKSAGVSHYYWWKDSGRACAAIAKNECFLKTRISARTYALLPLSACSYSFFNTFNQAHNPKIGLLPEISQAHIIACFTEKARM